MASLPIPIHSSLPPSRPPRSRRCMGKTQTIGGGGRIIRACRSRLEPLYDDGYRSVGGAEGYIEAVDDLVAFDRGPPRWFCPLDCGPPIEDAPLLLFLPGIDGIGLGLFMHHKALGRIFEVRCMHVPFCDRTPFEGLVKFVEDLLRLEHSISQTKPIYLLGHSFGGCLALSVAARNPNIDLILILSNPATSFDRSLVKPFFGILKSSSYQLDAIFLSLLCSNIGNQVNIAFGRMENGSHPLQSLNKLSRNLLDLIPRIQNLLDSIPRYTVSWKLKLFKSAADYANSRLHAVKAEVLVLASCLDNILPSREEAKRLGTALLKSKVHYFEDHGHSLLLENGIHLSTIIKVTNMYRHSRQYDYVRDHLPPSIIELAAIDKENRYIYQATSPVMFSTLEDGKVVRGLSGIPNEGPVLLIGNHMLLGLDMFSLFSEFLREKRVTLRGMGHPGLFLTKTESSSRAYDVYDRIKLFGGVPVSSRNFYRLLSEKSYVLLYPGGAREALHRKGEEYELFWPIQPEFVRMATQFGATIIPFGTVGEDDLGELLLDYNDLTSMPFIRDIIKESNRDIRLPTHTVGDARNQEMFFPCILPKIPGRFYHLFGKPIITSGKMEVLKDREQANDLYLHVKSEVESIISYLLKKRKEDIHRSVFQRILYQASCSSSHQIPTFGHD